MVVNWTRANFQPRYIGQRFLQGLKATPKFVGKNWFIFFALFLYLFFAAAYMGRGFTHCTDSIYGFGDSTGGPIWRESLSPSQPLLGGPENATNYPYGENLYSPVAISGVAQTAAQTVAAKVVGPVCSYNLSNVMGYLTTALLMMAFIWYLTKSRWIGLLAGYAVSFSPYFQSKIGGHPSYAYGSLLIALVWLLIHVLHKRRTVHAVLLGVVLGICLYFDPYFILLAGTVVGPILVVWIVRTLLRLHRHKVKPADVRAVIRPLCVTLAVVFLLALPLLFVVLHNSAKINASVSAVRGDEFATAMQCSNEPLDYLLPDPYNVTALRVLGPTYTQKNISHRSWCGSGESRVSISLTLLVIIVLGVLALIWERVNGRRTRLHKLLSYNPVLFVGSIVLIAVAAFLIGLPPRWHGYIMPSDAILWLTKTWRVFAREYVMLNIAVVILFSVMLKYLSVAPRLKRHRRIMGTVFVLIFLAVTVEYHVNPYFRPVTFSYSHDIPKVYHRIKNDPAINAVAEYPLDRSGIEQDSIVYYTTMQAFYQKKLFNSAALVDDKEAIHIAMKDLTDPQTIPALRYLGIDYVVIHGVAENDILSKTNQLQLLGDSQDSVYSLSIVSREKTHDTILAKIVPGPQTDRVVTFKSGYVTNMSLLKSPLDTEFQVHQNAQLTVTALKTKVNNVENACFEAEVIGRGAESVKLSVRVNGRELWTAYTPANTYNSIVIPAKEGDTITLHNSKNYDMDLNNLGCRQ